MAVWNSLWPLSLSRVVGESEQRNRFAYALREAMAARRMSGRQLSMKLEVDPRKVARWLDGAALPNLYEAAAIAAALRIDERLFREPPEVPPTPPKPYYPIEQYLLEAVESGVQEGVRRARAPGRAAPGRRAQSRRRLPREVEEERR